jgi:Fe-S oxidoreductase
MSSRKKKHPSQGQQQTSSGSETLRDFLERCTSCGACAAACDLLNTKGTPDAVIAAGDEDILLCTNCGACGSLCPSGLDPAEALLQAKNELVLSGKLSPRAAKSIGAARSFISWSNSFPFVFYGSEDTVFWPGCSLAAHSPAVVMKSRALLESTLGKKIGLALDCCSGPAYHGGDLQTVEITTAHIKKAFESRGTKSVIAACMNCVKILRRQIPGMKVDHVLEVIPAAAGRNFAGKHYFLHHPCPAYRFPGIADNARILFERLFDGKAEQPSPRCCGLGGNMHVLFPQKADDRVRAIIAAAGNEPVVTYCMSCRERLLRNGRPAVHLLEALLSIPPKERPSSSARKWFTRMVLALRSRLAK